jgi:hypothetical protein
MGEGASSAPATSGCGNNASASQVEDQKQAQAAQQTATRSYVTFDEKNQTATLTQTTTANVTVKDAQGNVVKTGNTTTTETLTVSTAKDTNGQILGGTKSSETTLTDRAGNTTTTSSTSNLNPAQAIKTFRSSSVEGLQSLVSPSIGQRLWDHKVGVGGTLAGGGIAVGCVLAEPCGAGVTIGGIILGVGAGIYDYATH